MGSERRRNVRHWIFISALMSMVFLIAMSFISEEAAAWSGFGRLSILFVLGVAWWNNETQIDL